MKPDDTHLVVGMANSTLSIRRREARQQEQIAAAAAESAQPALHAGTYRFFVRGKGYLGGQVRWYTATESRLCGTSNVTLAPIACAPLRRTISGWRSAESHG